MSMLSAVNNHPFFSHFMENGFIEGQTTKLALYTNMMLKAFPIELVCPWACLWCQDHRHGQQLPEKARKWRGGGQNEVEIHFINVI